MNMLNVTTHRAESAWQRQLSNGDVVLFGFPSGGDSRGGSPAADASATDSFLLLPMPTRHFPRFIFIDFEASSLSPRNWPIEIGLAYIADDNSVCVDGRLR